MAGLIQQRSEDFRSDIQDINRRGVLRGALSLGALTFLTGCDVSENSEVQSVLRAVRTMPSP